MEALESNTNIAALWHLQFSKSVFVIFRKELDSTNK